jgi:hypothetical protein
MSTAGELHAVGNKTLYQRKTGRAGRDLTWPEWIWLACAYIHRIGAFLSVFSFCLLPWKGKKKQFSTVGQNQVPIIGWKKKEGKRSNTKSGNNQDAYFPS